MFLRTKFTVTPTTKSMEDIRLPIKISLDDGVKAILNKHETGLCLLLERKIDRTKLELANVNKRVPKYLDGHHKPAPSVRIKDDDSPEIILAEDFISGLSFLFDTPINISRRSRDDKFIPENKADQEVLDKLGTDKPTKKTSIRLSMRTFNAAATTDDMKKLMQRRVGLRIYAAALKNNTAVAQFRDLWRVLESAFTRDGDDLVALLATYPEAKKLRFDKDELRALCILRGRASHAQSSSGLRELINVNAECAKQLPRLKNLCERVILTKKSWGYPTIGIEEVLPLSGFMGPNSSMVIFKKSK